MRRRARHVEKIAFDHGDKPLKFFTADRRGSPLGLHDYAGPCEPLFMVIKDDSRVEIKGLDAPKLRAAILEKLGVAGEGERRRQSRQTSTAL